MAALKDYERMTVHIPRGEARRYKTLFRALGLDVEKKNALDRALDDIEAGRVHTYNSVSELMAAIG